VPHPPIVESTAGGEAANPSRASAMTTSRVPVTIWVIKVARGVAATPVTYAVVGALKRHEGIDVYGVDTDFNSFHLRRA
jgi:hypothetical protein